MASCGHDEPCGQYCLSTISAQRAPAEQNQRAAHDVRTMPTSVTRSLGWAGFDLAAVHAFTIQHCLRARQHFSPFARAQSCNSAGMSRRLGCAFRSSRACRTSGDQSLGCPSAPSTPLGFKLSAHLALLASAFDFANPTTHLACVDDRRADTSEYNARVPIVYMIVACGERLRGCRAVHEIDYTVLFTRASNLEPPLILQSQAQHPSPTG